MKRLARADRALQDWSRPMGSSGSLITDPYESETARCTPREFADRYGFKLPEAWRRGFEISHDDPEAGSTTGSGATRSGPGSRFHWSEC